MSYSDVKEQVKAAQESLSYDEVKEMMKAQSDFMLEMDNLKPKTHNWVDRGMFMSCEGAGHPNHRSKKM